MDPASRIVGAGDPKAVEEPPAGTVVYVPVITTSINLDQSTKIVGVFTSDISALRALFDTMVDEAIVDSCLLDALCDRERRCDQESDSEVLLAYCIRESTQNLKKRRSGDGLTNWYEYPLALICQELILEAYNECCDVEIQRHLVNRN
jgi:hypothetical protein